MPPQVWKVKVWYYDIKTHAIKTKTFKDLSSAENCITKAGNEFGMGKVNRLDMYWYWQRKERKRR